MILAIVLIALLLLLLWSGSLYLVYLLVGGAAQLPWVELAAKIQAWLPPSWLAGIWEDNLHRLVPLLEGLHPFMQAVEGWFALALGIVWAGGAFAIALLALIVCVIVMAVRAGTASTATPAA